MTDPLNLHHWCVLNGQASHLSKQELFAVWEVEGIRENRVIVKLAPYQLVEGLEVGRKAYPRSWLTRYPKKVVQNAEAEEQF